MKTIGNNKIRHGTVWRGLATALASEFRAAPPGTRLPSVRNLQERFHCARETVGRALDELEVRGAIVRLPRRGVFTSGSNVKTIYFLTPCPVEAYRFDPSMFEAAQRETVCSGIELVPVWISRTNDPNDLDWRNLKQIPEYAAVIVNGYSYCNTFAFLNERHCNVAFITEEYEFADSFNDRIANWHLIHPADENSVIAAVEYLARRDCRRILLITGDAHEDCPCWRRFRTTMRKNNLRYSSKLMLFSAINYATTRGRLQLFDKFGLEYDGVVAMNAIRGRAAADFFRHHTDLRKRGIPMACCGTWTALHRPPAEVAGFDSNYLACGAEAVRVLSTGIPGPTRKTVECRCIPPLNAI